MMLILSFPADDVDPKLPQLRLTALPVLVLFGDVQATLACIHLGVHTAVWNP